MSYYDNNDTWSSQSRQASWEQPGRQAAMTPQQAQQAEPNAFAAQFEEIERATDNLTRSGKWFPGAVLPTAPGSASGRRDSAPSSGYGSGQNLQRQPSANGSFDNQGAGPSGLQNYYQGQRFPTRQNEAEQMLHAKRRMAAQRERELRNYHQEQQYNRSESNGASRDGGRGSSTSSAKQDRSASPNATMSEEDRRDLIARQHRALYGDNSNLYIPDGSANRAKSQDVRGRGTTPPHAYEQYSQAQPGADGPVQMPPRGRAESTAPSAGQQGLDAQRAATTSPAGGSPPQQAGMKGVAPIGTRPGAQSASMNKRSTTPLTPSSLGYGYSTDSQGANSTNKDDRSTSASSNPPLTGEKGVSPLGGGSAWGSNSGVWGKVNLNSQASVWG